MAILIKLKKSSEPGKIPNLDDLEFGELAINYADGKLYFKNANNTVESFDTTPEHRKQLGLTEDDHPQYIHLDKVRTITASHVFDPLIPEPPFTIGPNAHKQLVRGLNTEFFGGYDTSVFYTEFNKPAIVETYEFDNALRWVVNHNKNTKKFNETLTDDEGNRFYAKTFIVDENTFYVELSSAKSGRVDVTFIL